MKIATIVNDPESQTVELPVGTEFPHHVLTLTVSVDGIERVFRPAPQNWDSFFRTASTEDFLTERASQHQCDREPF